MSIISIENITKIYNETEVEVHAVNGIDLNFDGGYSAVVIPLGDKKTLCLFYVSQEEISRKIRTPAVS